jgi:hypothetical protein
MNADERRLNEITEKIVGCAYDVANGLGSWFLRQTHHTKSLINLRSSAFISGSIFSRGGAGVGVGSGALLCQTEEREPQINAYEGEDNRLRFRCREWHLWLGLRAKPAPRPLW